MRAQPLLHFSFSIVESTPPWHVRRLLLSSIVIVLPSNKAFDSPDKPHLFGIIGEFLEIAASERFENGLGKVELLRHPETHRTVRVRTWNIRDLLSILLSFFLCKGSHGVTRHRRCEAPIAAAQLTNQMQRFVQRWIIFITPYDLSLRTNEESIATRVP